MSINVNAFEDAFFDFLDHVTIVSKDYGRVPFRIFNVQNVLLDQVFTGLREDVHYFVVLKARQLGSTTMWRLLIMFWNAMFPGLQSSIVAQDESSIHAIRFHIEDIIENLPRSHKLPIISHNRNQIVFDTEGGRSSIDFLVAGTKQKTGNLGRSRAYNCSLMTEVSSYGDVEGFESLKNTFSGIFPFRLYGVESTARGYNLFHDEWEEATEDTLTKRPVFLAWWMHEQYQYDKRTKLFARYGYPELNEEEKETAAEVEKQFGYKITLEQWAWYRHRKDPRARGEVETAREDREELVEQEYPSYPEQAFLETGSPFIHGRYLTPLVTRAMGVQFLGYRYQFGSSVLTTQRIPVNYKRAAQLRVFQEPVQGATYVVACDPARSENADSDAACIQVIRCWSDVVEQVAVFRTVGIQSAHLTWVLIDLLGWYGSCRYILEINGEGAAIYPEFQHLKTQLETGRLSPQRVDPEAPTEAELEAERTARSLLRNVRTYLYRRIDSLGVGFNMHWVTSPSNKEALMVQYADRIILEQIRINCVDTVHETKNLRREGGSISAEGKKKDDRALCLAMAVRCWLERERSGLEANGRTFASEQGPEDAPDGALAASNYMTSLWRNEIKHKSVTRERTQRWAKKKGRWGW